MSYIKIWIHAVWTTKNKEHYLTKNIRQDIFKHIKKHADSKGIHIDFINGYIDHVHCLLSLDPNQAIGDVMQMIKGESSHWINKHKLVEGGFAWQNDYYAASVSESHVKRVRKYIKTQEEHHRSTSLGEEVEEFFNGRKQLKPLIEIRGH